MPDPSNTLTILDITTVVVEVGVAGPQGTAGATGAAGPSGVTQNFSTPSSDWVFNHNLGYLPNITVIIGGAAGMAEVLSITTTSATIHFNSPQSGTAVAS